MSFIILSYYVSFQLRILRERDSSLLVDIDYDHNLFAYEKNSSSPVLKGGLKTKLGYWHTIGANDFLLILSNSVIESLLLVLLVVPSFITMSQPCRMQRLLSSRLYLN